MNLIPQLKELSRELTFLVSRSSGPGGQNVNKVNSRVTLKLDIENSSYLSREQKDIMIARLSRQLTSENVLLISVQESRSQLENKMTALQKLEAILHRVFTPPKKRKPTKPSGSSRKKRRQSKIKHSEKKQWRRKI